MKEYKILIGNGIDCFELVSNPSQKWLNQIKKVENEKESIIILLEYYIQFGFMKFFKAKEYYKLRN